MYPAPTGKGKLDLINKIRTNYSIQHTIIKDIDNYQGEVYYIYEITSNYFILL